MSITPKNIGLVSGPLAFILILLFFHPEGLNPAANAILAYADGDFDYMNEVSADTVMFFEPSMGKAIPVVNPANEFLSQIQSPYDSITRSIWNAIPLKREGDDFETVLVSFIENRYKDGEVRDEGQHPGTNRRNGYADDP